MTKGYEIANHYYFSTEPTLWYDPNRTHSKQDYPYSYDAFFIYGNHKSIKDADCDYIDRYTLWDNDRLQHALCMAEIKGFGLDAYPISAYKRFIKAYYGEDYELVGVVEWCNQSNGYPCWSLHFKKE